MKKTITLLSALCFLLFVYAVPAAKAKTIEPTTGKNICQLSQLNLSKVTYFNDAGKNKVYANKSTYGQQIIIKGNTYKTGVGTHATSKFIIQLNGATSFHTDLGIDDNAVNKPEHGIVNYTITAYQPKQQPQQMAKGIIKRTDLKVQSINIDVKGKTFLVINFDKGAQPWADHVDLGNAYFEYQGKKPILIDQKEYINKIEKLTASKLDCAKTVFSLPNVRFMQKIRSTKPNTDQLSAQNLPNGLTWNKKRNLIEGIVQKEGVYTYQIAIERNGQTTYEDIKLTVDNNLQMPKPFMGWLSWNSVQEEVSEDIVKKVVQLFKQKGLYQCGWNTIMLDDQWQAYQRNADNTPKANEKRFPNGIKAVSDYVHQQGMKFGLYTDAAERTCANAYGSYGFEKIDADTYAQWNIDIVKCDYCHAPSDVNTAKQRYQTLAKAFQNAGNKTTLYICEWGERKPWTWGAEVGGRCWRISQDVRDCWTGKGNGEGVVQSIRDMKLLSPYQGVNRFNDADMLCTGLHATGKSSNDLCGGKGPGMTQDEYRTQFALWCMWSSPMALSFDPRSKAITQDDYNILTNKQLIALNQDPMGQQADLISEDNNMVVFAKDCANGDVAISVTNMNDTQQPFTFNFEQIPALEANQPYYVCDVWNNKILNNQATNQLSTNVKPHATQVFRLSKNKKTLHIAQNNLCTTNISAKANNGTITINMPDTKYTNKLIRINNIKGDTIHTIHTQQEQAKIKINHKGIYILTVETHKAPIYTTKIAL